MKDLKPWAAFTGRMFVSYLLTALVFGIVAIAGSAIYAFPYGALNLMIGAAFGLSGARLGIAWRRSVIRSGMMPRDAIRRLVPSAAHLSGIWSVHRHHIPG